MGRGQNPRFPSNATIRELWVQGKGAQEIADQHGMHVRTVYARLKKIDEADDRAEQRCIRQALRPEYV